jgi:uncharacterized membrane protein YGL010W
VRERAWFDSGECFYELLDLVCTDAVSQVKCLSNWHRSSKDAYSCHHRLECTVGLVVMHWGQFA